MAAANGTLDPALAEPRPPVGIAIDGDLGVRPDAWLAVALLNGLSARNEARRISLSVSRPSLTAARLADVVAEFYPTLPLNAGVSTIGMLDAGAPAADAPALAALLAAKTESGTPIFASHVQRVVDTADSAILIRNTLLGQHDGNARIVLAGPATGLARLLGLYGARPQLMAKVERLVVAIGAYPHGSVEPSVASDIGAARRLFAEWPTPLVAVGSELGAALRYPASTLVDGLAGAAAHPVVAAYRALGKMPYDAPTAALAATLHAVHPEPGYFRLSEPGTISVEADGRTRFTPTTNGRHRYLVADPAQRERLLALYVALVSAAPAPRPVPRRPPLPQPPPAASAAAAPAARGTP